MGSGGYSSANMTARVATARSTGKTLFTHHAAVQSGTASTVHASLDVKVPNKSGIHIRESRDTDEHPESEAFVVGFDVTGSMDKIPKVMVEKLPALMGMLLKKGVSDHPQIMFAAIGDAEATVGGWSPDKFPLQVGQFESDNRMDDAFTNIILEGGGGGQKYESYDLFLYYLARHTALDCYEKRGVKGIVFVIGDERVRAKVSKELVKNIIGDTLETDIPISQILDELREKYEVFYILPKMTSYYDDKDVNENLKTLFAERFIKLEDPAAVCEVIATAIAVDRGLDMDAAAAALAASGATAAHIASASTALAAYVGTSTALKAKAAVTGDVSVLDDEVDTVGVLAIAD